jgi:hypothetical protein
MGKLSNVRTGMITSSEIVALTKNGRAAGSFGAPFYTYVEECIAERFFKHKLENERDVPAFSWGKLCEIIVHDALPTDYIMQSEITYQHPTIPEFLGTPDGTKYNGLKCDTVTDIKCPLTRKGFYNLVKFLYDFDGVNVAKKKKIDGDAVMQQIREHSNDGEKYYWQLVSNACILEAEYAELIVFMPYVEDIEEIKEYNRSLDEPFWLVERAKDGELPFIYKESGIENINIIRFKVPQEDKDFLTSRVLAAIELINK